MASTAAVASGVTTRCAWPGRGESVTELMPFMNFLVHLYIFCSHKHASPYLTFIRQWISMGFTTSSLPKKRMTERCSSSVHVAKRGRHFYTTTAPSCWFLYRTATCRPLFKASVSLLSTYKTIELCFEFLSHFWGFHFTLPRKTNLSRKELDAWYRLEFWSTYWETFLKKIVKVLNKINIKFSKINIRFNKMKQRISEEWGGGGGVPSQFKEKCCSVGEKGKRWLLMCYSRA